MSQYMDEHTHAQTYAERERVRKLRQGRRQMEMFNEFFSRPPPPLLSPTDLQGKVGESAVF